jgi:hypothetical protein
VNDTWRSQRSICSATEHRRPNAVTISVCHGSACRRMSACANIWHHMAGECSRGAQLPRAALTCHRPACRGVAANGAAWLANVLAPPLPATTHHTLPRTGMPHRASQCQSMLQHTQPCPTMHSHASSCSSMPSHVACPAVYY